MDYYKWNFSERINRLDFAGSNGFLFSINLHIKSPGYRYLLIIFLLMNRMLPVFGQIPSVHTAAQTDSLVQIQDSVLRIRNLNPYFTLHVDSTLNYDLEINKVASHYYWYIKNSPLGLKINKDNGQLSFKASKAYFLSGKLKYDYPYKVNVGVQNLQNPAEQVDTSFTILFFTTDIIPSRLKPSVNNILSVDEGDTINFRIECEEGSFPLENISFFQIFP